MITVDELKYKVAVDLEKGLVAVEKYVSEDAQFFNAYLLILGRFKRQHKEFLSGQISQENFQVEKTKITNAILHFLDEVKVARTLQTNELNSSLKDFPWREKSPFYTESFDNPTNPHSSFRSFQDGIWKGNFFRGSFQLTNLVDPTAVKYQYFQIDGENMANHPISLEVKLESKRLEPKAAVGLIFSYDRLTRQYLTFHINEDAEYQVWQKGDNQYLPLFSGRSNLISPNQYNRLAVLSNAQNIYLFINDSHVKTINLATKPSGDCGILAIGQGNFFFDNFQIFDPI